jgi:diacylglycerol kinase (ATP)
MTTAPLRIVVAINPQASFGHRREVGPRVVEQLRAAGHDAIGVSEPNFELLRRETIRAVGEGADALVVVGGDGMVSMGTNIVAGTELPLGLVASGTGNDVARGLGLPLGEPDLAVSLLIEALKRPARRIDAGLVQHGELTTWFAGVLSAGFDAVVNERANNMAWPKGKLRYTLAILRELATLKPIEYDLIVDGKPRTTSALLISVANNRSLGGGMQITPDAIWDDGLLDLFIVTPMSRLAFLRVFPKVFSGTHTELPVVQISRVSSVRLSASGVIAYADGERVGSLPVQVDVVPGALNLLA